MTYLSIYGKVLTWLINLQLKYSKDPELARDQKHLKMVAFR